MGIVMDEEKTLESVKEYYGKVRRDGVMQAPASAACVPQSRQDWYAPRAHEHWDGLGDHLLFWL